MRFNVIIFACNVGAAVQISVWRVAIRNESFRDVSRDANPETAPQIRL